MNKPDNKTGFFEELKRRNVVRVGVAYLVTAWLLLQAADIVLENIEAPLWIMQAFMLFLAIGLPIALIFAWAFELTPEGLKREKDVDRTQSITPQTGRKLDFMIIGIMAAVIVLLLVDRFTGDESTNVGGSIAADNQPGREQGSLLQDGSGTADAGGSLAADRTTPSIAVLPFVNMSSDPEQEFFSDGISEEILNSLARVKELKVAGRTSSFAFKGQNQDLRQIGETLGVDHILEGSVRKSGTTVRITAQLIQVEDGFHLWSDTYDRELTNVFAIQDEIATAILEQMKAHLVGIEESSRIEVTQRTDPEVYDRYLQAKQRIYERKQASLERAAKLLDEAIAKDPEYAPAYAQRGIAALLLSERQYGELTQAEADSQGKLYIDKALQLDPESAEALAGLGLYHLNRPTELRLAIEPLEKALGINPSMIDASNWLQIANGNLGDNTRALEILEQMVERDPMYVPGLGNLVLQYNLYKQEEKSWALIERVKPLLRGDPALLQAEARTWMSQGQPSMALPLLEEILEIEPNNGVVRVMRGWCLIQTGQFDQALEHGVEFQQAIALNVLGRQEEALDIARKLSADGYVGSMIGQLASQRKYQQLVEFVESRWTSLDSFEQDYPDSGDGYGLMLDIAVAYSRVGNSGRFDDAMARVRAAHDRAIEQGLGQTIAFDEARYWILQGDPAHSLELLAVAEQSGMVFTGRIESVWSEFESVKGDPEYEAIVQRVIARANHERAALGLEPKSA
jgi:TolB-like protein/Tfp pilus assembly protein PilF